MYSAIDVPFIKLGMASYWLRQRNTIRRYECAPHALHSMSFVVKANYLQALSWSLGLSLNLLSTSLFQTHLHHLSLRS
jgi:hypothetical protein